MVNFIQITWQFPFGELWEDFWPPPSLCLKYPTYPNRTSQHISFGQYGCRIKVLLAAGDLKLADAYGLDQEDHKRALTEKLAQTVSPLVGHNWQ